jgi:hypothetical protein
MRTQSAKAEQEEAPSYSEPPTLYALAREALGDCDNDADKAEAKLFDRLSSEPALLRALARHAIRQCVGVNVTKVICDQRAAAFRSVGNLARQKTAAIALGKAMESTLLDMPLADGTRLRDATVVEIKETAERWENMSRTMAHRARFLHAIVKRLPPGKSCGSVLNEAVVLKLYESAA